MINYIIRSVGCVGFICSYVYLQLKLIIRLFAFFYYDKCCNNYLLANLWDFIFGVLEKAS